jgi:hypothetical protein
MKRLAVLMALALATLSPVAVTGHDPDVCGTGSGVDDVRVDLYDGLNITGTVLDTWCYNGNANGGIGEFRDLGSNWDDRTESLSIRYIPSQGNGAMLVSLVNTDPIEDHVLAYWCVDSYPNHYHINLALADRNKADRVTVWEFGSSC